jgi:hypothetical protein
MIPWLTAVAGPTAVEFRGTALDALACRQRHSTVRVLPHIEILDDCFGQFLVRAICNWGACREIEPERSSAWSAGQ